MVNDDRVGNLNDDRVGDQPRLTDLKIKFNVIHGY